MAAIQPLCRHWGVRQPSPYGFLDFLIYQPIRAVLLHGPGVPVLVPAPERYAIHKLIVGRTDADGSAKSRKDRVQARMTAMIDTRQGDVLADAFMAAWARGDAWKDTLAESMRTYDEPTQVLFKDSLAKAMADLEADPKDYGLGNS